MPDFGNLLERGLHKLSGNDDSHQKPLQQHQGTSDTAHGAARFERGQRTPIYPQPGHVQETHGTMPPRVASLDYRGKMRFFNHKGEPHDVMRDLGFSGVIDGKVVWCWGDTLMGTQGKAMICCNDSTSIGSVRRPMHACDTAMKDGHVQQWIPATDEEKANGGIVRFAYGGTNIIEYAPNKGLVYYLKNDRKGGGGGDKILGAGVSPVHMEGDTPHAKRVHDTLWTANEPHYGDVGIAYDPRDKHVYVFGHGPHGDKELSSRTYLCRVPAENALDIHKYEYWDNADKLWRKRRMTRHGAEGTIKLMPKHAIFDWFNMNQSAPFWSNYFNKWMLLYQDCFGFSHIRCKTADHLQGPWSDHGEVAKTDPNPGDACEKAFRYCGTGHPWIDPSGKTVLVTWTRANWIWGVVITWA